MMQEEAGKDKEHTQELAPMHDVYALGDCCARMDLALPALAQVQYIPFLARYCARTSIAFRACPWTSALRGAKGVAARAWSWCCPRLHRYSK